MRIYTLLLLTVCASPAFASPQCTTEPKAKWMAEADMKAKIAATGDKVEIFKITKGNCYEIYGRNAKGKRIEIYFNPVTGEPVKES